MKKAILASALLVFFLASFVAVIADEVSENNSALESQEADVQQSLSVIKPISAIMGYAETEDGTDAQYIRMWIGKVRTIPLTSDIIQQAKDIRKQYKDDKETMKEKLTELAQSYKADVSETDSYQGLLVIGKGKDHETYRLLSKDISNESVSFYILEKNNVSVSSGSEGKGFFLGLGKKLGFVKKQTVVQADISNLNPIGEITLDKESFDSITLWKGSMEMDSGTYKGSWNLDTFSAGNLWWPRPWWGKTLNGQDKVKAQQNLGQVEED